MEIKDQLLQQADFARKNAYAPYSNFQVGAAVYAAGGKIYASCNVENVSFPCGTCAEAGAIAAMVSDGERIIKAILIVSDSLNLVYPCGACLQRIAEFAAPETPIYLASPDGIQREYCLKDLIPHNFKASELSHD